MLSAIAIIALSALSLSGCRATKTFSTREVLVRDSVTVTHTVRDTVVRVEQDSSLLRALLECDSLGQVRVTRLENYIAGRRMAPPQVVISDNVLTATACVDSMEIYMRLYERQSERIMHRETTDIRFVETNVLRPGQKAWIVLGKTFALALLGLAFWGIYKLR